MSATDNPRIKAAAAKLLARIDTEQRRPPSTPSTHLIGGFTKVGAQLEGLLRVALEVACKEVRCSVTKVLPTIQGRPVSLRRATAGQLARALDEVGTAATSTRLLVDDLRARESVILQVVRIRNDAAHAEHIGPEGLLALAKLRRLVARLG